MGQIGIVDLDLLKILGKYREPVSMSFRIRVFFVVDDLPVIKQRDCEVISLFAPVQIGGDGGQAHQNS